MDLGPLEGPAKRASIHENHPVGEPRHTLQYCPFCFRSFGIDVLAALGCSCGRSGMLAAGGTLEEMQRLKVELEKERNGGS